MTNLARMTALINQFAEAMEEQERLIERAEDHYGEWLSSSPTWPAENVFGATEEQLRMMLALLQEDHLKNVSIGSLREFRRWADGEDVSPWSARFVLNWLVLRREHKKEREQDQ